MLRRGIGPLTGIHGTSIESAILVDNLEAFESIRKAINGGSQEFYGNTGFKIIVGGRPLGRSAIALVPPYPAAVYDVVQELILYGARKIVAISRGYSLRRNIPPASLILAQAAMARDSVTSLIVPQGMPLLASRSLYATLGEEVIRKGQGGFASYYRGKIVVTVDSVRAIAEYEREYLDKVSRYKDVVAVDTVTAPLYAMQYIYPSLETSSLIYIEGDVDSALKVVEEDIEQYQSNLHKFRRMLSLVVLELAELLGGAMEVGV
jgi:hypothetical protein